MSATSERQSRNKTAVTVQSQYSQSTVAVRVRLLQLQYSRAYPLDDAGGSSTLLPSGSSSMKPFFLSGMYNHSTVTVTVQSQYSRAYPLDDDGRELHFASERQGGHAGEGAEVLVGVVPQNFVSNAGVERGRGLGVSVRHQDGGVGR
eukprot:1075430-Prorocentrum_minimum.AAC.1